VPDARLAVGPSLIQRTLSLQRMHARPRQAQERAQTPADLMQLFIMSVMYTLGGAALSTVTPRG
jgi:hypothetical protein